MLWAGRSDAQVLIGGGFGGASLRVQVTPRDTEVFIDNYYAGGVDDFDGLFQRLHVDPGAHDITLWRQGYRTVRQRIYIQQIGSASCRERLESAECAGTG